jgi:hypothetical protein
MAAIGVTLTVDLKIQQHLSARRSRVRHDVVIVTTPAAITPIGFGTMPMSR